jgi:hypothetical protein
MPTDVPEPPAERPARQRVSARAVLLGLLLLPLNAFWLVQMEMASNQSLRAGGAAGPYPTTFSLFANVVFILVLLLAANALLRRLAPRRAFTQGELLTVYLMLALGTCVTSVDFLDVLFPMLAHPTRYATANGWQERFIRFLPPWFYVSDAEAVRGWYLGSTDPYVWERVRAWLPAVGAWSLFILALLFTMLCFVTLVRRQWTEREHLTYPIIQLPLEMTEAPGRFIRQRLLWAGFSVAAGLSLLNGLHDLYPSLPAIPVKFRDMSPYFPEPPWNAMGWTPISFYPFAIGMGFLLPVDLLFSSWAFYWLWKAQRVVSAVYGWNTYTPQFPYVNEQCFGGYLGIALLALWAARRPLARVVRNAWRGIEPSGERTLLTSRGALIGLAGGSAFLTGFFWLAGLSLPVAALAFLIYGLISIAVTRMRAELGPPAHDLHNGGPDYILTAAFGTNAFSARELTILTWFYWFNRAYRSHPMPVQLEGYKMAERRGMDPRGLTVAMLLAMVAGTLSGCWALYWFGYRNGLEARMAPHLTAFGWEAFNRLSGWLATPKGTDVPAMLAIALGGGATLLLHTLRMRFLWWPLHPLGLAVSASWSMNTIWLPLFLAWVAKVVLLRYGGLKSYRTALPFFLGLILGDFMMGCLWPIIGWAFRIPTYSFQQ